MGRTYNIIDADGHVLEPVDLWDTYIDPAYRNRAPRLFVDSDGKERLRVEGKVLGSPKGLGLLGAIGARQGAVSDVTMKYVEGKKGGFDPHARIVDLDVDGIDAAFLYPSLGLFSGAIEDPGLAAAVCRAYNRWLADYCRPYPDRLFGVAMLPMPSVERHIITISMGLWLAAMSVDWGGVCDRFPRVRIAVLESGGGWIAPWLDRMDRHFDDEGFNDSGLSMRPSELFQRNCWISFEPA